MMTRRQLLQLAAALAAATGVDALPAPVRAALRRVDGDAVPRIIYLQGLSCTGCSISLLQASSPSPLTMITEYAQLTFHADLSAASGARALEVIHAHVDGAAGPYVLAMEGAIPAKMPQACTIGHLTLAELLRKAGTTMTAALAVGSCASHGGIPAAEGNVTGAVGLKEFFAANHIDKPVIKVPGCPVHPDWVWHTVVHLVTIGMPELVDDAPALFFGRKVHEQCPRYHDFQEEIFAEHLGDKGCLFKLGCLGPDTPADCPTRGWNGDSGWCVASNAPCIGCASKNFARRKRVPFYRIGERQQQNNKG